MKGRLIATTKTFSDSITVELENIHPEAEKEKLLAGLPKFLKAMPIKIGLGTKESMKQEVEMMLFLNVIK